MIKRYAYDAANRQTGIEMTRPKGNMPERFLQIDRYGEEGLRYGFLYDRGGLAGGEREDAHTSYTRGYDSLVLTQNGTNQSYFVLDEMGSTLFLLNKDHEIQKTYHYEAFGAIKDESGDLSNHLIYTGQMYDSETSQYYLRQDSTIPQSAGLHRRISTMGMG